MQNSDEKAKKEFKQGENETNISKYTMDFLASLQHLPSFYQTPTEEVDRTMQREPQRNIAMNFDIRISFLFSSQAHRSDEMRWHQNLFSFFSK